MPSDFLIDLIDHKKRVGFYLQKFVENLFQQVVDREDRFDPPQMSLVDLARTFCRASKLVDYDGQVERLLDITGDYLGEKRLHSYQEVLQCIVCELFERAVVHDNSKFSPEEYEIYEQTFPELNKYGFGTEQFRAAVEKLGPALQHHLKTNRHHPEWHENGINGMNLLDVVEMTCDWMAAASRSKTGIDKGLEINKERFKISDQLHCIIKNTVIALNGSDNKER